MAETPRLTTREVCARLGARSLSDTLALLKAAQIGRVRCGSAWLWDAHGVERLIQALRPDDPRAAGAEAEGGTK